MATSEQLARQWLETDAAFGVSEVPIPSRRRGGGAATAGSSPAAAAAVPAKPIAEMTAYAATLRNPPAAVPQAARPPARPAPTATKPPASPPPAFIPGVGPGSKNDNQKSKIVMPPAPAGAISALPPITRPQKEAALEALRKELDAACAAHLNNICTRVVFGEGDIDAAIMFVGEGPGAEEDKTGRPFVGRSGQLLDKMIGAIGFQRGQVYIANIVKLRAADLLETGRVQDRPPTPEEVARGIPFLHRQIEIIRPKVIVTLGAPAVKHLTGTTEGVMKIRGTWLQYRGIPVMPTYHPSFVLRAYTEENRRKVWEDLKEAAKRAGGK